ncbi:MAG: histidinol-phosphate transaminase [Zetaproteobacteria bacterium]|nr:histidinol-phosphate transaminase [Zetaproteobacteria bacterium]
MIREDICDLAAYHVADATGMIKLDAMENPYALPSSLDGAWCEAMKSVAINRYPDAEMYGLRAKIAKQEGIDADQVLIGNGSDEIIQMLIMAASPGACVSPSPSFVMYEMVSKWLHRPFVAVPLQDDFTLNGDAFLQACRENQASLAFLPCPNNPTGNLWDEAEIQTIADGFSGLLIIDEAYLPFAGRTHTQMISSNVMVMRTFSKLGWAGLRLGYLMGDVSVIAELNKVRLPYNINSLTQAAANLLLDHADLFSAQTDEICRERGRVMALLEKNTKLQLFPSDANFILMRLLQHDAITVFQALKERKILIKCFAQTTGALANCLRVTIGTYEENEVFMKALGEVMQ